MDGPSHYLEAERLLAGLPSLENADPMERNVRAVGHAILALAAATADPFDCQREWSEVTR